MKSILLTLSLSLAFLSSGQDYRLIGLTGNGGDYDEGAMYEYDISSGTTAKLHDFDYPTGDHAYGELFLASNGKLYGLTYSGGLYNTGALFEYDWSAGTFSLKYSFAYATEGRWSLAEMVEVNGFLYGTTSSGGALGGGTLFKYELQSEQLTILHDFENTPGQESNQTLFVASNGLIYGTTRYGGANSLGKLFSVDPSNDTYTLLQSFSLAVGTNPYSQLIEVSNGILMGTAFEGGANNEGSIYEYNIGTDALTLKASFDSITTGRWPIGGLVDGMNGKLYGTSNGGGTDDQGVLYEYDLTSESLTGLIDLDASTHGMWPWSEMVYYQNSTLFGVMNSGGVNNEGVLFEYDYNTNTLTKRLEFDYEPYGRFPYGAPLLVDCDQFVGLEELAKNTDKELVKITDLLGREVDYTPNTPLIYIYSDGSIERVFNME